MQASLDALIRKGDSTVVLVAHRLSTVMNADKIAVIADGGVKEEGSHDELCAKGGVYAGLVRKQLTKAAAVLDQGKEDVAEAKAANDTIDKIADVRSGVTQQWLMFTNVMSRARTAITLLRDMQQLIGNVERITGMLDMLDRIVGPYLKTRRLGATRS